MSKIKFCKENNLPLEMHKVRIIQKLNLLPIDERLKAKGDWQEKLVAKFKEDFGDSL